MKRFAGIAGSLLMSVVVSLVTLEAAGFVAIKAGWLNVEMPRYTLDGVSWFWKVNNRDFGVWHAPHEKMYHEKQCFAVTYRSNAFGMRDSETAMTGDEHRVVVLGDSFVEGWGVERKDRLTEVLERETGIEHLNFGTSGGFGSTQSYILYKTLASRFSHDAVIFAVLPDNDFFDDLPTEENLGPTGRWRPFLVGRYPDYRLVYPDHEFEPQTINTRALQVFMAQFWITSRVFNYFRAYFRELARQKELSDAAGGGKKPSRYYSGYFDYGKEHFLRLRYAIEQIKAIAGKRPVLVVTIPRQTDFRRAAEAKSEPPLRKDLQSLAEKLGITYIDLMTGMAADGGIDAYYHDCDGHWSKKGHAKAARIIGDWRYYAARAGEKLAKP